MWGRLVSLESAIHNDCMYTYSHSCDTQGLHVHTKLQQYPNNIYLSCIAIHYSPESWQVQNNLPVSTSTVFNSNSGFGGGPSLWGSTTFPVAISESSWQPFVTQRYIHPQTQIDFCWNTGSMYLGWRHPTTRKLNSSVLGRPRHKTSQELRMLSSVTINCQITKSVMNSGSQLSEL